MINYVVGGTLVVVVGRSATGTARAYTRGDVSFRPGASPSELIEQGGGAPWRVEEDGLVRAADGRRLPRMAGHLAYWFGWFAFHPNTPVYGR